MKALYEQYLFEKHILVKSREEAANEPLAVLVTLGRTFGIRVNKNPRLATLSMIRIAESQLGNRVPEPFYRGFPDSVRELSADQLLFDQLYHYTQTYGCGWFDQAGHSVLENMPLPRKEALDKVARNPELGVPKDFDILEEAEATRVLKQKLTELMAGARPLNTDQILLLVNGWQDFGRDILPARMPCKDTVIRLLYGLKEPRFCRYLKLSDTIKLLGYIQWTQYGSEDLKKLNLKNQDRKLLKKVLDQMVWLESRNPERYCDYIDCFEKRKLWCGMLHHLHYQSRDNRMQWFIRAIRKGKNLSSLSRFEKAMRDGQPVEAAQILKERKGESVLMRNLNYILSRCETEAQTKEVFTCLEN